MESRKFWRISDCPTDEGKLLEPTQIDLPLRRLRFWRTKLLQERLRVSRYQVATELYENLQAETACCRWESELNLVRAGTDLKAAKMSHLETARVCSRIDSDVLRHPIRGPGCTPKPNVSGRAKQPTGRRCADFAFQFYFQSLPLTIRKVREARFFCDSANQPPKNGKAWWYRRD
jgi:hypothetical protein